MFSVGRQQRLCAATLLLAWLPGGCFGYVPLTKPAAPPAAALRVRLQMPADYRLTSVTVNDVGMLDGELVQMDDSTLVLSATRVVARSGFEHLGENATLQVPRANIASLEVKQLARGRTVLFVGGLLAFAGLTSAAFGNGGLFGTGTGGGKQSH